MTEDDVQSEAFSYARGLKALKALTSWQGSKSLTREERAGRDQEYRRISSQTRRDGRRLT